MQAMHGQRLESNMEQMMSPFDQQSIPIMDDEPLFSDEQQQTGAFEAFTMPRYADESSEL